MTRFQIGEEVYRLDENDYPIIHWDKVKIDGIKHDSSFMYQANGSLFSEEMLRTHDELGEELERRINKGELKEIYVLAKALVDFGVEIPAYLEQKMRDFVDMEDVAKLVINKLSWDKQ